MRSTLSTVLTLFVVLITSCDKDAASATILGKWNLINDSKFIGVGINNHPVNYTGQTGDYFDFRTDGNLYIKEGAVLDTLPYTLTSDTTILILSFGIILNGTPEISSIKDLSAHSTTINAPVAITPGGQFGRTVNLNR